MSGNYKNGYFKDCEEELLNYKFDEILDYYSINFDDDVADFVENKVILEIGGENPDYESKLNNKIKLLWYELIIKIIDRLHGGLKNYHNSSDFSEIIIELEDIKKRAKEEIHNVNVLKDIYFEDIDRVKIKIKSKKDMVKGKNKEKIVNAFYGLVLVILGTIFGYIASLSS
jgi:hypothetical protein